MQFNWTLPDVIIYSPPAAVPALIGMWKAFLELRQAGWVTDELPQALYRAEHRLRTDRESLCRGRGPGGPWPDPWTIASGLPSPGPLGDKLMRFGSCGKRRAGQLLLPTSR